MTSGGRILKWAIFHTHVIIGLLPYFLISSFVWSEFISWKPETTKNYFPSTVRIGLDRAQASPYHSYICLLDLYILWRICPLLGNDSANTFPKHTLSTIRYPLLGNGPINTHSWQQKTVFSVGSLPRSYKRAQAVVVQVRIEGVQRSTTEFNWKSEQFQWSVQSEEDDTVSDSDLWTVVTSCIKVQ
jgi:hypothetical protein